MQHKDILVAGAEVQVEQVSLALEQLVALEVLEFLLQSMAQQQIMQVAAAVLYKIILVTLYQVVLVVLQLEEMALLIIAKAQELLMVQMLL